MYARRSFPLPFLWLLPFLIVTISLETVAVHPMAAQRAVPQSPVRLTPLSPSIPNHYLVAYRNASIPRDVEARTSLAGAHLLARHEHIGMAVVEANSMEEDTANLRSLAAQPNVDFVVHDRLMYAHQIRVRPTGGYHNPIARPLSPVIAEVTVPAPVAAAAATPDSFYRTPQGWAVRQVGGYGNNVLGGPAHGPWDTTMGRGVRIAILDSGVDAAHPDIAPNLVFNQTEVNQTSLPSPCDDGTSQDQQGHGTWTASLAAGAMGADTGLVIGVAPAASILNIKVLERMPDTSVQGATIAQQCATGEASGLMSWVLKGIDDAVAQHADVISLSLGAMVDLSTGEGAGLKALFDRATYAAAQSGAVVIAAAGNDGFDFDSDDPRYIELPAQARSVLALVASTNPACAENVTFGATCAAGPATLAYYSNFGTPLNALAAPGGSVPNGVNEDVSGWIRGACSSGKPGTIDGLPADAAHSYGCFNLGHTAYVQAMGTSAAAPLAAGVAALLRAAHPAWDAATIIATMRSSATMTAPLPYAQVHAAAALGLTN